MSTMCHSCGWLFGPYPYASKYVREDGTCENCDGIVDLKPVVAQMKKDLEDAAGELLVDIPKPGTVTAKLLSANVLLRRENETLRNETLRLRESLEKNRDEHYRREENAIAEGARTAEHLAALDIQILDLGTGWAVPCNLEARRAFAPILARCQRLEEENAKLREHAQPALDHERLLAAGWMHLVARGYVHPNYGRKVHTQAETVALLPETDPLHLETSDEHDDGSIS